MNWRAVVAGVGWGVGYLGVCYLFAPLRGVGLAAAPLLLGAGPLAGAAAGWLTDDHAGSVRHALAAGVPAALAFAWLFWYSFTTPFGASGAFYAAKYTYATSAGALPILARQPTLSVATLTLTGAVGILALAAYAGRVAERRDHIRFVGR